MRRNYHTPPASCCQHSAGPTYANRLHCSRNFLPPVASVTLDPLPLIHCFLHLHFTSLGDTLSFPLSVSFAASSPLWGSQGNLINCPLVATKSFLSLPCLPGRAEQIFQSFCSPKTFYPWEALLSLPRLAPSVALNPMPLIYFTAPQNLLLLGKHFLSLPCLAPRGEVARRAGEGCLHSCNSYRG